MIIRYAKMGGEPNDEDMWQALHDDEWLESMVEEQIRANVRRLSQLDREMWEIQDKLENGGRRPRVNRDYRYHHYDLVREYFGTGGFTDENGNEFPPVRLAQYDHKIRLRFRMHRR